MVFFAVSRTRSAHSFGEPAVTHRVAKAVVHVDSLGAVRLEHGGERLEIGVNVAEDPRRMAVFEP